MGLRGPAKKPTALKVIQGTAKQSRLEREPLPPTPLHANIPPDYLCEYGKARWKEIANELSANGCLTDWDWDTFAAYCEAYGKWRRADLQLKSDTAFVAPNGQVSGWYTVLKQSRQDMVKIGSLLGLNPSARAGLNINKTAKDGQSEEERMIGY